MDFYSMMLAKKLNKESGGDVTIESLVVTENGNYSETGKAYSPVVVNVQPTLETLNATVNGTYTPQGDGYSEVTVNVQPTLETLNATANGTYTPQGDGYDEVNVNVPLPENGYLLETETGNPITVTDAGAFPLASCDVDLEPIQDLHGYDHPWVGDAGKNKLPLVLADIKAANTSGTWSGNVYSINNCTIEVLVDNDNNVIGFKANGTPSPQLEFYMPVVSNLGNVIINGCPASGSDSTYFITSKQGSTWSSLYDYGNGYEREITSNESVVIVIRSGYNAQNLTFYPMIRLSTETDATFAPYTNICPISGRSEVAIQRVGKNKLPMTLDGMKASNTTGTWSGNTYTINGGTITVSTDDGGNVTAITVNGTFNATTEFRLTNPSNLNNNFYGYVLNGSPTYPNRDIALLVTYIEGGAWKGEQFSYNEEDTTINQSFATIIFSIYVNASTSVIDKVFKPMLRLSTETDPTYEPYAGKTYTIQIGQTVYGGQLDVTRGKMVVTHGEVDLGSLNWTYDGGNIQRFWATLNGMKSVSAWNGIGFLCSNYSNGVPDVDGSGGDKIIGVNSSEIYIRDTSYTDAATFKNALQNSNAQLVYELATPITIPITPTLIELLQGTNTISADDDLTIKYFGKGVNA